MAAIDRLLAIMARLRDPAGGCPWDREQTYQSLIPHTLEEAYEVADAIAHGDLHELRDELGDLLFQVVFYAEIAREQGAFDFAAVADAIADKLERRHPHVFGDVRIDSAHEQTQAWESHKAAERAAKTNGEPASLLDGVARALPALSRAAKLQRRAARVGFDWPDTAGVLAKLDEELAELRAALADPDAKARHADEVGDLLFTVVNLARHLDIDPEAALRAGNDKFAARFRAMEAAARRAGQDLGALDDAALDALWVQAKATG